MNNLLACCGLVDERISVSEKDLPVQDTLAFCQEGGAYFGLVKIQLLFNIIQLHYQTLFANNLIAIPITFYMIYECTEFSHN